MYLPLLTVFALLGAGCTKSMSLTLATPLAIPTKEEALSARDTWKEYQNSKIGFSIKYPAFVKGDGVKSSCVVPVPVLVTEKEGSIFFFDAYSLKEGCQKYEDGNEQISLKMF